MHARCGPAGRRPTAASLFSRTRGSTRTPRARGAGLIEVLVAVLVLSIGLLGLARLQTTALRVSHGAYLRTQAVFHGADLAERLRAGGSPPSRAPVSALPEGERTLRCTGAGDDRVCALTLEWRGRAATGSAARALSLRIRP